MTETRLTFSSQRPRSSAAHTSTHGRTRHALLRKNSRPASQTDNHTDHHAICCFMFSPFRPNFISQLLFTLPPFSNTTVLSGSAVSCQGLNFSFGSYVLPFFFEMTLIPNCVLLVPTIACRKRFAKPLGMLVKHCSGGCGGFSGLLHFAFACFHLPWMLCKKKRIAQAKQTCQLNVRSPLLS